MLPVLFICHEHPIWGEWMYVTLPPKKFCHTSPGGWISLLVFSVHQNPGGASITNGGMNLPLRVSASFFRVLYIGFSHMGWGRFKVDLLTFKGVELGWIFPLQMTQSEKFPHRHSQKLWFWLIPSVLKLTTKKLSQRETETYGRCIVGACVTLP